MITAALGIFAQQQSKRLQHQVWAGALPRPPHIRAPAALCQACWGYADAVMKVRLASPGNCGIVDCGICEGTGLDPLPLGEVMR